MIRTAFAMQSSVIGANVCGSHFWTAMQFESFYPGIQSWLLNAVEPGIRDGSRRIWHASGEYLVIAKRSETEKKLCTFWIDEKYRGTGLSRQLLKEVHGWLGVSRPIFTIPEERVNDFACLLNLYDYRLYEIKNGFYRRGKREFVYNGSVQASPMSCA